MESNSQEKPQIATTHKKRSLHQVMSGDQSFSDVESDGGVKFGGAGGGKRLKV